MNTYNQTRQQKALGELAILGLKSVADRNAGASSYRPLGSSGYAPYVPPAPNLSNLNAAINSARLDKVDDAIADLQSIAADCACDDTNSDPIEVLEENYDDVIIKVGSKTIRLSVED